ncbi:signal transduction histidine kinase/ActR/RegA family two-component response regulator [Desulfomicrobium macestii]|uniref:histidine kinase n=1 Tax=Desulfomicrobium macestii TaxID=90731 RepID=A0ABR9GYN1_9BACT|nr:ATP-binding protein [Desulfomicrobium macestii]MBE1423534.1 signal transduction histidine kinase/ActR/RegA family two-component response regulator [Desulfomicrobium macestii]
MFSTRRSLSLRLIISMGLLSLAASTILAAAQLHFKYKSNIAAVHGSMNQVASGDLKSISASLWQLDTTLLDIQLQGLVARPNFVHAAIVQSGKTIAEAGRVDAKRSIRREFELTFSFNDQPYALGKLVLVASLDGIRAQVGREFLDLLMGEVIVALVLVSALLFLFHRQVGMHLHSLAAQVRDISPVNLEQPIALGKKFRNDELDQVTASLEKMRRGLLEAFTKLSEEVEERRIAESRLSQAKEQAESATLAKTQFLANMSHEIRTPMNGVMGMLQLAMDNSDPAVIQQYLQTAMRSSRSLLRLLNDILDLSRLEASRMPVMHEPFDIRELMEDLTDSFQAVVLDRGLALRGTVDETVPTALFGDTVRIRQILTNLIGNAVKFTLRGKVEIRVSSLTPVKPGEHRIFIEVEDTGVGIPDKAQTGLFAPFAQADSTQTRKFEGSGLGLSITQHLVVLLGGSLAFESSPSGSLFAVCLPLQPAPPLALRNTPAPQPDDAQPMAPLKVLVAEDNPVNSTIAMKFLEGMRHTPTLATTGLKVLEYMRSEFFDLVLMDIQMPEMDGLEATRIIRSWPKSEGGETPIVAMTAHAFPSDTERFMAAGMNGHLAKPISRQDLERFLRSMPTARQA